MAYHCPRCNAGYTYKKTLKTHMKYDCGKEPRFKCPYCNKRDKCSSNIYKHIRMRHDGKPVEKNAHLQYNGYFVEMLVNATKCKRDECALCKVRKNIFRLLFNCEFLSYTQLSEWRNLRTMSSYICSKCNAGFRRMWDMLRHKCGQTRYACPYCHKKDNSSSNVYRHIRRWHPNHPVGVNRMF